MASLNRRGHQEVGQNNETDAGDRRLPQQIAVVRAEAHGQAAHVHLARASRSHERPLRGAHPTAADAEWADAIVFGTPTRFGAASAELKAYIDSLGGLWFQGKLNGKAGSAFGSSSSRHGGNESTLLSLYNPFAHLGLIVVPLGYAGPAMFQAGTPYGATAVSGQIGEKPIDADLEVARFQGRRVTQVAAALKAGGITTTKQDQADQVGAT